MPVSGNGFQDGIPVSVGRLLVAVIVMGVWGTQPVYAQVGGGPPADTGRAKDGEAATKRAIVTADSLSAFTRNGERMQELFDNVRVRQDTTRLQSDYALRYLNRDEFLFTGDVVIYERGDTLRADTVRYNKRTKVGRARSNVRLTDGEVVVRAPRAVYHTEEKRSVFPDSVTLVDSARVLRAQSGTYWSNERRAAFKGHVRLTDPETYLEADSLTYYRDRERSIASGRVFIRRVGEEETADTTSRTYLFGQWADNQEANRYSLVRGNALLVRVRMDSTGAPTDTLLVRGHRLEAFRADTHRRLVAVDSVRVWENDLSAVADSMVYDRVTTAGPLDDQARPSGRAGPSAPRPPGTGARSEPDDRRRATRVPTDSARGDVPVAQSERQVPLEETRLFRSPVTWFDRSQVSGDSIRVRAHRRRVDTVFVRGRAFAAQRDSTLERIQQLKGKNLTAYFRNDALRRIEAAPNAQAIRFLKTEKGTLKGAAKVSGDRIVLRFRRGAVHRTSVLGGVESTYYRTPGTIPDPFRLDGFQWTPERKPTKEEMLRRPHVHDRLRRPRASALPLARRESVRVADSLTGRPSPSTTPPDTSKTVSSTP